MKRPKHNRRTSWIDITFSIAIITLTVAAILLIVGTTKQQTTPTPEKGVKSAMAPPTIETIDSNYPGIKIIIQTSNDTYSPYTIQYPQSIHTAFNEEIVTYIDGAREDYLIAMEGKEEKGSRLAGELNISFETLVHHSGNYSFILVNGTYMGGANGTTEIRSFQLNPETGGIFGIQDVLGNNLKHLEQLSKMVREKIYNDTTLAGYVFPEEVKIQTEPNWQNFSNFAITNDSLIFYFEEHAFTAGAVGPPIIAIPIDEVDGLLVDEFKMDPEQRVEKQQPEKTAVEEAGPPGAIDVSDKSGNGTASKETTGGEDVDGEAATTPAKRIALTFDDGPDPKVTTQILDTLDKYDAKATFFMLGSRVEYYPEITKRIFDAGHELGNHTWNHPDLTKLSAEKVNKEITRTSGIIEKVTGKKATVFRPPYGAVNAVVRAQTDLPVILWEVDTLDWKHRNADKILEKVKGMAEDGSVVLMHDIHQSTADGLEAVLLYLKGEGYIFVTVSELE